MPVFKNKDVDINYATFGDSSDPALLFSNSLGTSYHMWQPQIDVLQTEYFIICYDTRGHGKSSAPTGPYRLDQLGQDVIDLLDHLSIDKAFFCGISMGGMTGQWLAIHHPDRFHHLMLCNTAAKIGNEAAWRDRAQLVRAQGLDPIAATAAPRWFTADFIDSYPDVVAALSSALAAGSSEGYASCCEALSVADTREQLKDIRVPITVVAGTEDPVTTVADGQYMVDHIPHSTLATIDASHISNIEQPEAFNQLVRQYLHDQ
ncbi:3-oxoadipate enol-lactonase [Psychrobacter sp. Cmf 22.2]|uniref:3-oxoadipate enol-lactonase n=1 Tax=Psychrobacter sp. Cmf 22.2 TaxID=1926478 RepID=UPI000946D3BF|nr:3-oxoadipate enol-lactonase [Psychrobacter sp. Cmf 22.2]OLF38133.1 3-oxoadipate enol-lactonase [Psychrobacter sp. Cmf 22.2]